MSKMQEAWVKFNADVRDVVVVGAPTEDFVEGWRAATEAAAVIAEGAKSNRLSQRLQDAGFELVARGIRAALPGTDKEN